MDINKLTIDLSQRNPRDHITIADIIRTKTILTEKSLGNKKYQLIYTNDIPKQDQLDLLLFDNHIRYIKDNNNLLYYKYINIQLSTESSLLNMIKNIYKPLYKYLLNMDMINKEFTLSFFETFNFNNFNFLFFLDYDFNKVIKNQDIILLELLIFNLYNYYTYYNFSIKFSKYQKYHTLISNFKFNNDYTIFNDYLKYKLFNKYYIKFKTLDYSNEKQIIECINYFNGAN